VPPRLTALQRDLLAWSAEHGRDLPWRHTRDPWSILVSEVMLQQTQVARVIPVWTAFLARFPTATDCANAPQADVVTAWQGMGYNRRARSLHQCAIAIRDKHQGALPATLEELLALPGVGPYTARAVMVFAFERRAGVLDVNAVRVLARLNGVPVTQEQADAAAPISDPWRWNQAILDLGATVCTKRAAACDRCPVARHCAWRHHGPDPAVHPKPQSRFEGSDRQGRGRLVDALRAGCVDADPANLAKVMGWPDDPARAERVAKSLVADGLLNWEEQANLYCLQQ
jgi:A/G-specific adenine glycosylase